MWASARDGAEDGRDTGEDGGHREEIDGTDNRKGRQRDCGDDKKAIRRGGVRQTRDGKKKDGTKQQQQRGAKVVAVEDLHVAARRSDGHRNHRGLHGGDGRMHGCLFGWNGHEGANGMAQTGNEGKSGGDADQQRAAHGGVIEVLWLPGLRAGLNDTAVRLLSEPDERVRCDALLAGVIALTIYLGYGLLVGPFVPLVAGSGEKLLRVYGRVVPTSNLDESAPATVTACLLPWRWPSP